MNRFTYKGIYFRPWSGLQVAFIHIVSHFVLAKFHLNKHQFAPTCCCAAPPLIVHLHDSIGDSIIITKGFTSSFSFSLHTGLTFHSKSKLCKWTVAEEFLLIIYLYESKFIFMTGNIQLVIGVKIHQIF